MLASWEFFSKGLCVKLGPGAMSNTQNNLFLVLDQEMLVVQENAWHAVDFILGKIQHAEY